MVDNEKIAGNSEKIFGNLTPSEAAKRSNKGTERRRKALSLARRKYCNASCPFYPCFVESLSRTKYGGKCALKQFPEHIQKRTLDFYLKGREGIQKRLLDLISFLSTEYDRTPTDKEKAKELINELIKIGKFLYGEKVEIKDERKIITYEDIKKAYDRAFNKSDKE